MQQLDQHAALVKPMPIGISDKVLCGQVEVRLCHPDGKLMQVNQQWD